jgi:hypothetical protein
VGHGVRGPVGYAVQDDQRRGRSDVLHRHHLQRRPHRHARLRRGSHDDRRSPPRAAMGARSPPVPTHPSSGGRETASSIGRPPSRT